MAPGLGLMGLCVLPPRVTLPGRVPVWCLRMTAGLEVLPQQWPPDEKPLNSVLKGWLLG